MWRDVSSLRAMEQGKGLALSQVVGLKSKSLGRRQSVIGVRGGRAVKEMHGVILSLLEVDQKWTQMRRSHIH